MKALKFYADWCGPCKGLSQIIEKAGEKITVEIEDVNIDTCGSLSSEYYVRTVPTMVLLNDEGKEIKRQTGNMDERTLLAFLKG
jgi:thioredoxin 1